MEVFKSKPNFKIIKKVGGGSFGLVYKVLDKNDNKFYAIKRVELNDQNKDNIKEVEKEAKILKEIKSDNVVKYIDYFYEEDDSFNIVMEFCEYSDLRSYIKKFKNQNKKIAESVIRLIITELSNGLKDIHSNNVIHRDLKPENIFISSDHLIKIGDFGISKILDGTDYAKTFAGTYSYMAPELINGEKYSKKVDIWSLGCIIYELCTLNRCFDSNNILELVNKINSGIHGKIDLNYYNDYLQDIIDLCLKKNDKERPNIEHINELISEELTLAQFKKLSINTIDDLSYELMLEKIKITNKNDKNDNETGSWRVYIENALLNKQTLEGNIYNNILIEAGIFGLNGAVWAYTTNNINKWELDFKILKEIFSQKSISYKTLMINGKSYTITNYNEGFSVEFKEGKQGGTIARTNLSFIIGIYDENISYLFNGEEAKNQNSDLCKFVVEDLAKDLIKINY